MAKRKRASARPSASPTTTTGTDIPEDEQWRLINASGVLETFKRPSEVFQDAYDSEDERIVAADTGDDESDNEQMTDVEETGETADRLDQIFEAVLLIVPLCFLYAMMDLSVFCNSPRVTLLVLTRLGHSEGYVGYNTLSILPFGKSLGGLRRSSQVRSILGFHYRLEAY